MFDEWVSNDVERCSCRCSMRRWPRGWAHRRRLHLSETCGNAVALEHNGDLYQAITSSNRSICSATFVRCISVGTRKLGPHAPLAPPNATPFRAYCRQCRVRSACHGECPKNRFITTPDGEPASTICARATKRSLNTWIARCGSWLICQRRDAMPMRWWGSSRQNHDMR